MSDSSTISLWDPAGRQAGLSLARQAPTIRAS